MLKKSCLLFTAVSFSLCSMLHVSLATVEAKEYPSKTIKLIIPYKPGGGSDTIMRPAAMAMEKVLGEKIAVVNVPGAGGAIGWTQAAKAKPDGYTITQLTNSMMVKEATKSANISIDDFVPVANIGFVTLTVTAKGDGPYKNLKEYYEAAKKNPGQIGLAMGVGTPSQFVAAKVEKGLGVDLKLVNAGGGADKKAAVLGGHVDALIEPISGIAAQQASGQLRVLAVLSDERLSFMPDVPTAKEQGFDITAGLFYGFGAPKGISAEKVEILAQAAKEIGNDPKFIEFMQKIKFDYQFSPAGSFKKIIEKEYDSTMKMGAELGF